MKNFEIHASALLTEPNIISCVIGDLKIKKALLDLGTSVNLPPSSIYDLFGFGELKSMIVTL